MKVAEIHGRKGHILYDADPQANFDPRWFDQQHLQQANMLTGTAPGRGSALFFQNNDHAYVLRHYLRGGLIGKAIHDRYLWTGLSRTRPWQEWHLLMRLQQLGLPAPKPFAARVIQHHGSYTADLMTHTLPDSHPLADLLNQAPLPHDIWRNIGTVIRQFHDHNVCHADLNARNILLGPAHTVFLIDFDKSSIRTPHARWKANNLNRLQRSLEKFKTHSPDFHFTAANWSMLNHGYQQSTPECKHD